MGCGWCTFVLHANNAVLPPVSLEPHMDRCAFNGGRVYLTPLTPDMYNTPAARKRTLVEAEKASREFSQSFPLVRGHASTVKPISSQPSSLPMTNNTPAPKKRKAPAAPTGTTTMENKRPAKYRPAPKPKMPASKPAPVSKDQETGQFDVPLSLPPAPKTNPEHARKSGTSVRLYVCPLCGDNALASLRERDEHLQASHNGELVFPCQICGLAYPLYIALRRHAALKHESDFDTVRYGRPELLDSDSVECPVCRLVAFTDRSVLKLHVSEVHKQDPAQVKLPSKLTSRGGSRKGSRRKSKYGDQNDGAAYAVSTNPQPIVLSRLEQLLANVSGDPAPISCRICRTQMDNAKEFLLHLELDHVDAEEECEQLGCQACGRIFFGPGGRIDLIGHLRVCHQDTDQPDALPCLQAEKVLEQESSPEKPRKDKTDNEPTKLNPVDITRPCDATFSSPRLRQLHFSTSTKKHPGFSCPLTIELPEDQDLTSLTDQIRAAIMETEMAADREGLMILAYCCPNCSRLFAGNQAPSR
ncbi:Zinc finger C2H2 [Fasciola gigantica]|uniref:Zinc finger C2H2 n=1 Tax=Fasciola gigantica TaxID=46835 RepID=A0A504Z591_FASGI|nr:Zinc finger C2H2 [Fasciola gigantica]